MIETAVYDTKPYDREYLARAACAERIAWRFHDFRLGAETAPAAKGAQAVCIFVNDHADRACLEALAALDVKLIALRCAGHNNVDLAAARALGLAVVRVPAYSPHAVAEHAIGLLLTLNRKIHRAYNRVRELNFSLSGLVGFDIRGKTVGIIGTGKIGRIAAQIFRGFEANVLTYDPFPSSDWAKAHGHATEIEQFSGTMAYGFPVIVSALIADSGTLAGYRIVSDPRDQPGPRQPRQSHQRANDSGEHDAHHCDADRI